LEHIFKVEESEKDVYAGIVRARKEILSHPALSARTHKHIANPEAGASAKRINMFLRWMARQDSRGVDFGLWKGIKPAQLICPLDVHTGNVGRMLGILSRKQDDKKAAIELTEALRLLDADDPVRFDFALFGLGVSEGWK